MVEDEGVGFDPLILETGGSGTGLGLRDMHKRLELFDGGVKSRRYMGDHHGTGGLAPSVTALYFL